MTCVTATVPHALAMADEANAELIAIDARFMHTNTVMMTQHWAMDE